MNNNNLLTHKDSLSCVYLHLPMNYMHIIRNVAPNRNVTEELKGALIIKPSWIL